MTTPPPIADVPGGLPDVATLARMANELFKAIPGDEPTVLGPTHGDAPQTPLDVDLPHGPGGAGPSAPAVVAGAAPTQPSAPGLGIAPTAPGSGIAPLSAPPATGMAAAPAVRGGGASAFTPSYGPTAPAFYFLDPPQSASTPHSGGPGHSPEVQVPPGLDAPGIDTRPAHSGGHYLPGLGDPLAQTPTDPAPAFDLNAVRSDFPILSERVNGKQLVWFDNAATTHKPRAVIERLSYFYEHENSNIHRAAHELAARATDAYEEARSIVARFIGASSADEIVFVRGTTEAINLVASSWGKPNLTAGDEVIVSHLEHHANIVPWLLLRDEIGIVLKVIPVDDDGQVLLDEYAKLLTEKTKLVSVTQVSNALGTVTPAKQIVDMAHAVGALTLVDGAQSVSHLPTNVTAMDTDFFVFSGHKIYGPTGIGVLYGKSSVLDDMPPYQGGGNMISDVTFERALFQPPPMRFEAGTGNIADAVGLGAALEYLERLGLPAVAAYEHDLLEYATHFMKQVPGLKMIGTAPTKASVLSFTLEGYRTDEVGQALSKEGIAVRTGHHCAQPILRRFGLEATVRPSLALYNTPAEVDLMLNVLHHLAGQRRR